MKDPGEEPLLNEILTDEELAALRRTSLNQGLDAMRRARRIRRVVRAGALAMAPALLVLALTLFQPAQKTTIPPPTPGSQQMSVAAGAPAGSGVKVISDEELFALFPGRSLALIGKPGQQQLVFLDAPSNR